MSNLPSPPTISISPGWGRRNRSTPPGNFRAFLGELASHSTAQVNLGARLLLENRSLTFANYGGLNDFETELLWMHNAASNRPS